MVKRDASANVNIAKPWNRQTFAPKIHRPQNNVATKDGTQQTGHQNIAHSQCYYKHVGERANPLVSVHSETNGEISTEGRHVDDSKQTCFSPD